MNQTTTFSPIEHKRCLYCGNNPTSHFAARFDSTVGLFLNPVFNSFHKLPGGKALVQFAEYLIDRFWDIAVWCRLIVFKGGKDLPPTSRGQVLAEEAYRRGWGMETAIAFGKPLDVYKLVFPNGREIVFNGLPRLNAEDEASAHWIDDKALMKEKLLAAGVRASQGAAFKDLEDAEAYFKEQGTAMIVKPRLGSRGRHTTTWITDLEDFRKAFQVAKQLGRFVIVEEHLIGSVYRATMVDGKLAGVLAGDPPRVTGDGVHTIRDLIALKNETRPERVGEYKITNATSVFLARHNYTLDTVLDEGVTIDLTEKIGLSYGGKSREVTPDTHPKLREHLERAAAVVNDPIIGFDFITPDVSADPDSVRWGIIECNALPFINLHHDPLEGEPVNVAGIFLDYIEVNIDR